jgi:hypothetical protein
MGFGHGHVLEGVDVFASTTGRPGDPVRIEPMTAGPAEHAERVSCQDANVRTTVDLPADLVHAAKVRAALRGGSLKELFERAIVHEVRGHTGSDARKLPGGAAFAAEDSERYHQ